MEHDLSEQQARVAEDHRGFVREMHNRLNGIYGRGGGLVLMVLVVLVAVALITGLFARVLMWVFVVTAVLAALFVVRTWIYRRRDQLRSQVEQYCQTNDVAVDTLLEYYEAEGMYPFFSTIFERQPRALPDDVEES